MNYQNLEIEIKEYSSYFKYCDSIMSKISLFFKEFSKSGSKFILRIQKLIEDISLEINKEEYFSTTLNKSLTTFCSNLKITMDQIQSIFTMTEKDIIDKITEFDKDYKTNNKTYLNKLSDLHNLLSDNKNKLEKIKNNYFDSCKALSDYDKKYISNKPKENMKEEEIAKINEQFEKLKQTSETKKVNYRIEVTKTNDLLLSNENYYTDIINLISKQEEEKSQFYLKIFVSFINGIKSFNLENKESIAKNEKLMNDIYIKRDLKMFNYFFNHINNKEKSRFQYEEFLDFENFNVAQNKNETDSNNIKVSDNSKNVINDNDDINEIAKIDINLALKMNELGKEPFIDVNTMDNEFIELDSIIFNLIKRDEKIDNEKFGRIVNYVDGKTDGCQNFIYLLMGHYTENLVKFNNLENIHLLNSALNMIINYIWDKDDFTYLSFLILHIGEKTVFFTPNNNYPTNYLCRIMSKNTIYHTKEFWEKLIILKIKMLAKIKLNDEFVYRKKNSFSRKDSGIISKFFGGKDENNEKIENEILYSQIYKEKSANYCTNVLSEYISHFINYDFIENKAYALIEQLAKQYDLNVKQKNYFLEMLNSNKIYQKIGNPYFSDYENEFIKCDTQEDYDKLYLSFNSNKKFKFTGNNTKLKVILFTLKYLNKSDIISILCLNKDCYFKIKKLIYKNVLIKFNKNIDKKKHMNIWKILLNYSSIKKKYNYKTLKESINKETKKDSIFDLIELDTIRTSFTNNQKENQEKLCNILKVTSRELPTVNYCQGMNHIAAFLLILCNEDEEETFYLFLSILYSTDYCSLVVNDLSKLNAFFYCFERLLSIMFPEMNTYLKNNKIGAAYFLSSWFITLFTNSFSNDKLNNNIKTMVKIFDLFLLSGWKSIFKFGIALIKKNSLKIFSLPYDKLVHYLNNEIVSTDFFKDEKYNELMSISINFKLSNSLINNLCKEYEMKNNIMNKIK